MCRILSTFTLSEDQQHSVAIINDCPILLHQIPKINAVVKLSMSITDQFDSQLKIQTCNLNYNDDVHSIVVNRSRVYLLIAVQTCLIEILTFLSINANEA